MNFIFLKFFLIDCFSKTIICDSSVIIPLGVMLVNHKIQIFLIILFVWLNLLISIGMEGPLATHVTFPMWTVRGKAISEFRSPNALPRAPTPLGTELVLHLRCVTLLTFVCMLRYSVWSVVPRNPLTSHSSNLTIIPIPLPSHYSSTQDRAQSRPHPSFTQLTTSRGAGVWPGNSAGGSKLLGLRGAALFSKILLSERRRSEFRIFGNGFSRSTES